jgi:hypothetical protein
MGFLASVEYALGAGVKVNGRPSFMAKSERQLGSGGFSPFIESVRWNQAAPFGKGLPE